ncbi:hypothetical protein [Moorena producens]|uniref:hypothetical protein n=1 Tax=Moorena producens TaxID=1155739 RepID=UPI003C77A630
MVKTTWPSLQDLVKKSDRVAMLSKSRYAPEAFRQSRRYANAKRGLRPQLPRLCD